MIQVRKEDGAILVDHVSQYESPRDSVLQTTVIADEQSVVVANGDCIVYAYGSAYVKANDRTTVYAFDDVRVDAFNEAKVFAFGRAKITVSHKSHVEAEEASTVFMYDESTAHFREDAIAEKYGKNYPAKIPLFDLPPPQFVFEDYIHEVVVGSGLVTYSETIYVNSKKVG